ncbi:PhzF family phenazine biosynthesis protein [Solwaraspora sp. WMMD406]|uniref:PhzF family phenazine biosynthesis protein n=1 Tax=Solwaraspora sp. WMMD406 TaxID=3016095 RepID=UPI002415EF04|nr:PhzF family phenazine biosynthesis protein [Solwaraspora sp. WMMD406]MDG4768129.1 PhzF family phenazine biosynthesis protein [Solwaraspora sp. WMMD406]
MTSLGYEIVDVFTDRPFAGNPLAVVFGAEHLASDQLQAIAREFNLSETVFLLPPRDVTADYRVRIFTPLQELPFAGHPSIGAAVTAARRGLLTGDEVVQECGAGLLPVRLTEPGYAILAGGQPTLGDPVDPTGLLAATGLTAADHTGPAPRVAGCGLEFHYLAVRPAAVSRAVLDWSAAQRAGIEQISVFSWEPDGPVAQARVFCPGAGVGEDPATGSAALGLGVWAVAGGLLPANGQSRYVVRQGSELRRPSTLDCTVTALGGRARTATVGGHVVQIAAGQIAVPPFVG